MCVYVPVHIDIYLDIHLYVYVHICTCLYICINMQSGLVVINAVELVLFSRNFSIIVDRCII